MRIKRFLFAMLFALITISSIFAFKIGPSSENKTVQAATRAEKIALATKRAEYMAKYRWTAKAKITGWKSQYSFTKGNKYTIPYAQPINGKYLFYSCSLASFESVAANASSNLYGTYYDSVIGCNMPRYGIDCSAFCAFVIGFPSRLTTSTIYTKANSKVDGFYNKSWSTIAAGDLLNKSGSHVMYVKAVNGSNITTIEQTTNNGIDTVERTRTKSALSSYSVVGYDYSGSGAKYDDVTAKLSSSSGSTSQPSTSGASVSAEPSSYYRYVGNVEYINGVGPNNDSTAYTNLIGNRDLNYSASWTDEQKKAGIKPAILDGTNLTTKSNKLSISGWAFVNGGQEKIVWSTDKYNWYDCTGGSYSSASSTLTNKVVNDGYITSVTSSNAVFSNIQADLTSHKGKKITLYFAVIAGLDSSAPMHFLTINNFTVSDTQTTPSQPTDSNAILSADPSSYYRYVGNIQYINGVGPNNDSTPYESVIGNRDLNYSASWTDEQKKAGIKPAILDGAKLTTKNNKLSISGCAFVNGGQEKVVWSTDKYNWYDCTGGSYSSAESTLTNYVVNHGYISSGQAMASKAVFDNISADLSKHQNKTITLHFAVIAGLDSNAAMHFLTINNLKVGEQTQTPTSSSSSSSTQQSTSSSSQTNSSTSSSSSTTQPTNDKIIANPSSYYSYVGKVEYINGLGPNNSTNPYTNLIGNRDLNFSSSWTPEEKIAGIKPAILEGASLATITKKITISGWAFSNGGQSKVVWSIDKFNWQDCTGGTYSKADTTLTNKVKNDGYVNTPVASNAVFNNVTADLTEYLGKTVTLYFAVVSELDSNAPMHFLTINNLKVSEQVQEATPNSSSSETSSSVSSSTQATFPTSSVIPPQNTSTSNNVPTTSEIINSQRPHTDVNTNKSKGCRGNISTGLYLIPLVLLPLCKLRYKRNKD